MSDISGPEQRLLWQLWHCWGNVLFFGGNTGAMLPVSRVIWCHALEKRGGDGPHILYVSDFIFSLLQLSWFIFANLLSTSALEVPSLRIILYSKSYNLSTTRLTTWLLIRRDLLPASVHAYLRLHIYWRKRHKFSWPVCTEEEFSVPCQPLSYIHKIEGAQSQLSRKDHFLVVFITSIIRVGQCI